MKKFSLCVLFLFVLAFNKLYATHSVGADLTYRCLGGNQYEITLTFYRDCVGIATLESYPVTYSSAICGFSGTFDVDTIAGTGQEITHVCPTEETRCTNGSYTGIQEWVYKGIVTLPSACTDWTFGYQLCCRNNAITNIQNPGGMDIYIEAKLDNQTVSCNNSPVFSNKPVPFPCAGQQFCFNHGAFDADGDSLVYQLITPYNTSSIDPVVYNAGLSAQQPVSYLGANATTFNPLTGDICMTPDQPQVTVVAVLVSEYRNGVLIGQVERDIQFTVVTCSNLLPSLTGINGTNSFSQTICAGAEFCFSIYSSDPDAPQITSISWDYAIPAGSLMTFGTHRDSARFCWTPSINDTLSNPHIFTVTVVDDNCPYIGLQIYSFALTVVGVHVNAGIDQTVACGATVNLFAQASGGTGPYNYHWINPPTNGQWLNNMGVGNYNVIATYQASGILTCVDTDEVAVLPGIGVPSAIFSTGINCGGLPIQFTDNSIVGGGGAVVAWQWNFGDPGSGAANLSVIQNPSHNFSGAGTYIVTLTVTSAMGCTGTTQVQVVVGSNYPAANFTAPTVCRGAITAFNNTSTSPNLITAYWWNFNDPGSGANNTSVISNPFHVFSTAGTFNVMLRITNTTGCIDSIIISIQVNALPIANAGLDQIICNGQSVNLSATGGLSYSWNNGGGSTSSVTVTPTVTTIYTVTVTDANGCTGTDLVRITVNPTPVANAGPDDTLCRGATTILTASGGGNYLWLPGGETTASITVTPGSTSVYSITITNSFGCTSQDQARVVVNNVPTANAGPDKSICFGDDATLTASGGGNYLWTTTGEIIPTITVLPFVTSTYTVVVTNIVGCTDTDNVAVIVNPIPEADYSNTTPGCEGTVISFTDHSTVATGNITGWNWSFGNGGSAVLQNPQTVYNNYGIYSVRLIVISNGGCRDTINTDVTVFERPVSVFTTVGVCEGLPTDFTNNSSISTGGVLTYHWNFADGNSSGAQEPSHTYNSYGSYPVSLVVTSADGCRDTVVVDVVVHALPVADFTVANVCEDSPAEFLDASTVPAGTITSWNWNFGDSTSATNRNPNHFYIAYGTYTATLQVTTNYGCTNDNPFTLTIYPIPVTNFVAENVCIGNILAFTDSSGIPLGTITTWNWNFGDGYVSTDQSPEHLYTAPGSYDVSLSVTSDHGCTSMLMEPNGITIYALPVANFYTNATDINDVYPSVHFYNETGNSGLFLWNFGDGDTSSVYSPNHIYPAAGIYDIQLSIIDNHGCPDTTWGRIEIKPGSTFYVPNCFTPNLDEMNEKFRPFFTNIMVIDAQIFDRWGLKIYEWTNLDGGWDGKMDGNPAQEDVYVYRIRTIDINDKSAIYIGHVSLVR